MNKVTQQFKDFREHTPKHIQWILLGAAFITVLILLALLLTHKSGSTKIDSANETAIFSCDPEAITLLETEVGESASETVDISFNMPVGIKSIEIGANGMTETNTCEEVTENCIIKVKYEPTSVTKESETQLTINWYMESQPDIIKQNTVSVKYSALAPKPAFVEPVKEPVIAEEPEEEEIEEEPEEEPEYEPEPIPQKAVKEVQEIAVENPFRQEPEILTPEKCSEFAIPGYDQSGRQIGWIKPEHGANYFHPFSDKDCSNPTGRYDITTGIITSLKDGSKIGTDSDHIGYRNIRSRNLTVPKLSAPSSAVKPQKDGTFGENALWTGGTMKRFSEDENWKHDWTDETFKGSAFETESVVSSRPYDRTFILRQFKPIPATIVSEVRADPSVYGCKSTDKGQCELDENYSIPVRATVDRNVYSDDGRTIILPTGTLLMGYLSGELPGPYQAFGRMNIKWYQFIRPDGVEFNFTQGQDPYSADAQGRMGVPGHGSTDYVEQMVMPILTSLVPAAVNMIAPIADTVINQIDLDNNTIVQSGTIRSSEMAKQDVINTWNKIAQKLLVDSIDNTVPPFSIAAGTRINVFSPVDLIVTCDKDDNAGKKCAFAKYNDASRREWSKLKQEVTINKNDSSWVGQVRSFDFNKYCTTDSNGKITINTNSDWANSGSDYRTILAYCESQNYQAKNNAKQAAYNESVKQQATDKYGDVQFNQTTGTFYQSGTDEQKKAYNQDVLGLQYDEEENIINPWTSQNDPIAEEVITCDDGNAPDMNGCCAGETYTDMGEAGFNCCPDAGGDCFPPIEVQ